MDTQIRNGESRIHPRPDSSSPRSRSNSQRPRFCSSKDRGKLLRPLISVRKHLPFAPAAWNEITIYHLLTHTSGIPDDAVDYEPSRRDRLVLHDQPTQFKPGEKWAYSNVGYTVWGFLLETISGQTYADFVQENIFRPLAMNDSGLDSNVAIIPRRAFRLFTPPPRT